MSSGRTPHAPTTPTRHHTHKQALATKYAPPDVIDKIITTHLEHGILPYAARTLGDAARVRLVATPWASAVQGWFKAGHWRQHVGLGGLLSHARRGGGHSHCSPGDPAPFPRAER